MMRLVAAAIALLLSALVLTGWRLSVMTHQRDEAQHRVSTLAADISRRDTALAQLNADMQATRKREAALRLQQNQASAQALHRETTIRRETDANPALRAWSAAALPADVIRLHSRPAFSNARDYLDWLSTRDKLPHSGEQPANAG
ncbi:Rz-like lysis system protein LysB [Pantoea allii]|nr:MULTISPECIES: Rz-like lysis system protein LysB [Pantoea]MCH9299495.1 Rz-like lysis system protein LysB [Pantoea allii]MDJ0034769.1 Rz-like lysis system protein LysB [Pantoea allii]MDJ0090474.1 Rz-like lysis system protein LysB [Pantoea allii]